MTPFNPHLLRAALAWIEENQMTPHALIDGTHPHVRVPRGAIKDGKVVLNVACDAIDRLDIQDTHVTFMARFSGHPFQVYLPMAAIISIYSRETGQGISMPQIEEGQETPVPEEPAQDQIKDRRSHLRVVK